MLVRDAASVVRNGDALDSTMHILKAMAKSLDAHTSFFSPEEAFEMRASLQKQFEGVGVVLREGVDGVMIADLVKGAPAVEVENCR